MKLSMTAFAPVLNAAAFSVIILGSSLLPMTVAHAQTATPAKSAPAKAGQPAQVGSKTLSFGGEAENQPSAGAAKLSIMTRDELRSCLSNKVSIRTRLETLDADRAPLEAEKAAIAAEQQAFRDERAIMEAEQKTATEDLSTRFNAFSAKVEASNARVKAFDTANRSGTAADRERRAIGDERTALEKERTELEVDRNRVNERLKERVAAYNAKAQVVDQRVAQWNDRNDKRSGNAEGLAAERSEWVAVCSNRRYREDDEIAIKAGK